MSERETLIYVNFLVDLYDFLNVLLYLFTQKTV